MLPHRTMAIDVLILVGVCTVSNETVTLNPCGIELRDPCCLTALWLISYGNSYGALFHEVSCVQCDGIMLASRKASVVRESVRVHDVILPSKEACT